jgi:putative membrane protein
MKIIRILILLPLAAAIVALLVGNRHDVIFKLTPAPYEIDVPLYMLLLGVFLAGLLVGGVAMTFARLRRNRRNNRRDLRKELKKEKPASGAPLADPKLLSAGLKTPIKLNMKRKIELKEDI